MSDIPDNPPRSGPSDDNDDDDGDDGNDDDDDDDDGHSQVDILLFPEDGLSGFEFPKAHLAQPFLQTVQRIMMTMTIMIAMAVMLNSTHLASPSTSSDSNSGLGNET